VSGVSLFFPCGSSSSNDENTTMARSLYRGHLPTSVSQKVFAACGSAVAALVDPKRGDMVGTLGEVTGRHALQNLRRRLLASDQGRALLRHRPLVTNDLDLAQCPPGSFGAAYATFMLKHGFHADDRSPVALVDDDELAYVLLRYRQVHDFWHVLCGLPPTLLGELALKWFELVHTDLPVSSLSSLEFVSVNAGRRLLGRLRSAAPQAPGPRRAPHHLPSLGPASRQARPLPPRGPVRSLLLHFVLTPSSSQLRGPPQHANRRPARQSPL